MESITSSVTTLALIREWLNICRSTHLSCQRLSSLDENQFPTRLVDVGYDGNTKWFLRTMREDIAPLTPRSYLTLSYRWGSGNNFTLLSTNVAQFHQGALICDLPQLFRDVIVVARTLHIRYIWIDALCIIQDSIEDWEAEASKMRHVYVNSACNIAASTSRNPGESMFRPREPEIILPRVVLSSLSSKNVTPHYIFEKGYWDRQIFHGPLHNRGWVFQERFLAPRVLYFGKDQVLWECLSEHKCEGFPCGIPIHYSDKNMDALLDSTSRDVLDVHQPKQMSLHLFNLWNDLVKQYTQCELTRPSDKLFAIAGIAKLFSEITGDKYVAGWWKSRLLESLDWRVVEPRVRLSVSYRAPSWSWASIDGPVRATGLSPYAKFLVEIIDVDVITHGPDVTVNILGGTLKLRCTTYEGVFRYLEYGKCALFIGGDQFDVLPYPDSSDDQFPDGKEVVCIPFKKDCSLGFDREEIPQIMFILAEMAGMQNGTDVLYKRSGIFVLYDQRDVDRFCPVHKDKTVMLI